ncbi:MAG: dihydroorotate dehydrogenase B (NAD(+)), electron transfer subunit [Candidatus Poribacteria bacterium]|nr:MAG: dihydroorotate dehydrogenase B (NAD(+)), electron transfer subunit [Candidatus Poribacteria bacterium]
MNRHDVRSRILEKRFLAPRHVWMRLECDWDPARVQPGQFLHLWLPELRDPLLRRPYTIYRIRPGEVEILFQVVGKGSGLLAEREPGERVHLLGPLGRGFALPEPGTRALIVGGGVGMASLFLLIQRLREQEFEVEVFIGARSRDYLLCRDEAAESGALVWLATEDGSEGFAGLVTELVAQRLERNPPERAVLYGCGPTPMMEALAKVGAAHRLPTYVALENRMGCALGVCLGCVVPIRREGTSRYERVCTEGPVFEAAQVCWGFRI